MAQALGIVFVAFVVTFCLCIAIFMALDEILVDPDPSMVGLGWLSAAAGWLVAAIFWGWFLMAPMGRL